MDPNTVIRKALTMFGYTTARDLRNLLSRYSANSHILSYFSCYFAVDCNQTNTIIVYSKK